MKSGWSAGTRLVLSGALVAASVIGVSWCFAELAVTPLAQVAIAMLMLPPMLLLAVTFAREAIRLDATGAALARPTTDSPAAAHAPAPSSVTSPFVSCPARFRPEN